MRKGFSLITALIFMILVATLGALALSLSTTSAKQTSDIWAREQAELLLQSGTEYALLAISGHNIAATNDCINAINARYSVFDINVSLYYIGINLPLGCQRFSINNIATPDSNLTVIIDTIVSTNDTNVFPQPIRLHRRTIQKP